MVMSFPVRMQRRLSVNPFDVLGRDLGQVLDRLLNDSDKDSENGSVAKYDVDVREDADHFYVETDLPGFKKEEIDITLVKSTLTITADHKKQPAEQEQGEWLLRERRDARFSRSFTLPETVNDQTVDATLVDGVLKITLNKREAAKPRKIAVN